MLYSEEGWKTKGSGRVNKAESRKQIRARETVGARISVPYQMRVCVVFLFFCPALTYQSGPGRPGAEQRG